MYKQLNDNLFRGLFILTSIIVFTFCWAQEPDYKFYLPGVTSQWFETDSCNQNPVWIGNNYSFCNDQGYLVTEQYYDLYYSEVSDIFHDSQGNVWIATTEGLSKYDGNKWQIFNKNNSALTTNLILEFAEDANGTIWMATDQGLGEYSGDTIIFHTTNNSPLPENYISAVAADGFGNIYLGTGSNGVVAYDGINWTLIDTSNSGIPGDRIIDVSFGHSGNGVILIFPPTTYKI